MERNLFEDIDISPIKTVPPKNPSLGMKYLDFNKTNNIGIFGATGWGKGVFINNLLLKHFIYFIRPENVYIMSPTFDTDPEFLIFRWLLKKALKSDWIYSSHVMDFIN